MPNRLAGETSPYLLQHANNPVDWFPWGGDALARAKLLDRPIFLSIGYAACHWCHVMERESFEDEATARLLNEQLRGDQGRSRGAAGPRLDLHVGRAGHDRQRRLADVRLPDARRRARSTAARTSRTGRATACRRSARCSRASRRRGPWSAARPMAAGQRLVGALVEQNRTAGAGGGPGHRSRPLRRGRRRADRVVRCAQRLVGRRAQVPPADDARVPAAPDRGRRHRGGRDGGLHARQDGRRRHPRPARRRLPSLRDRPALARARTSSRCSTTTPSSRARTCMPGRRSASSAIATSRPACSTT